ncbi:MAG: 50S ribosome-binding GTPase [Candidatus Diapherotrites archaeon]|nr:50S ribosome-binding GTPase [Candidatus Diapherotrites archaeon]
MDTQSIMDKAIRRAQKENYPKRRDQIPLLALKRLESRKMKLMGDCMESDLHSLAKTVPSIDKLTPFVQELLNASIPLGQLRKVAGHLQKTQTLLIRLQIQAGKKAFHATTSAEVRAIRKQFTARADSFLRNAKDSMETVQQFQKHFKRLPHIEKEAFTFVLAGYPNTGKSTLLNRLTGSTPKIADYPFTTQEINVGKTEYRFLPVQFLDTPGLLDRPLTERNPIERKAMAALAHTGQHVLFVFDPTLSCGYSFEQQMSLLREIRQQFGSRPLTVILNKTDIAHETELRRAQEELRAQKIPFLTAGPDNAEEVKEKVLQNVPRNFYVTQKIPETTGSQHSN